MKRGHCLKQGEWEKVKAVVIRCKVQSLQYQITTFQMILRTNYTLNIIAVIWRVVVN